MKSTQELLDLQLCLATHFIDIFGKKFSNFVYLTQSLPHQIICWLRNSWLEFLIHNSYCILLSLYLSLRVSISVLLIFLYLKNLDLFLDQVYLILKELLIYLNQMYWFLKASINWVLLKNRHNYQDCYLYSVNYLIFEHHQISFWIS